MRISPEKIERAEVKLKQLEIQREQLRQRLTTQSADRSRRDDTRRKILIGSVFLSMINKGQMTDVWLNGMLDRHLTREDDRALFGLPVKAK